VFDTFEKLQELEKEGYVYEGAYGFTNKPETIVNGIYFVQLEKYGEEIKLEFDIEHWPRIKKYLRIN
jgi:hypothetical protein